jgi:hypothetical protein
VLLARTKCLLHRCNEASVHFEELLAVPASIQLIVGLARGITESHGGSVEKRGRQINHHDRGSDPYPGWIGPTPFIVINGGAEISRTKKVRRPWENYSDLAVVGCAPPTWHFAIVQIAQNMRWHLMYLFGLPQLFEQRPIRRDG